jgi:glycerate kinase
MQALGARLLDASGNDIPLGGGSLAPLDRIDLTGETSASHTIVRVASDVTNTLCGPAGTAIMFGPQKGASPNGALSSTRAYALGRHRQRDCGVDVLTLRSGGAAGEVWLRDSPRCAARP